jgi:hypothetical protein
MGVISNGLSGRQSAAGSSGSLETTSLSRDLKAMSQWV